MKFFLKTFAIITFFCFFSCGNNNEIVTQSGEVIEIDELLIDKDDKSNPKNDGEDDERNNDEE